jgi:uncharacterized SAM-binding protein YcdF (DUF218 family)
MQNKQEIKKLAQKIWDYHLLHHKLKKVDVILVLGSHDIRVAERGAELWLQQIAPIVIFSGGIAHNDDLLRTGWDKTEAETFAERAMKLGVPKDVILIENKSTNTGENILFTKQLLKKNNIKLKSMILVQKPYMERRAYTTFMKQWGEPLEIMTTSPQLTMEEYLENYSQSFDSFVNLIVGDLQRIKIYPEKGFQIPQKIPDDVWQTYKKLVALGYDKHLIK